MKINKTYLFLRLLPILFIINTKILFAQKYDGQDIVSKTGTFGNVYKTGYEESNYKRFDEEEPIKYDVPHKEQKSEGIYLNPRDKYYKFHYDPSGSTIEKVSLSDNDTLPWFDLPGQQLKNIMSPPKVLRTNNHYKSNNGHEIASKTGHNIPNSAMKPKFHHNSFDMEEEKVLIENVTTCKEFAKGAVFDPKDILDLDWLPFYSWRPSLDETALPYYALVHKFTKPTVTRLDEYKRMFMKHLVGKVDWGAYKLLLSSDIEMLLFAKDRRGLFAGVAYMDLPEYARENEIELPVMELRIKFIEPYLAIMYCDYQYAIILSRLGQEPKSDEKKASKAKILPFRGIGQTMDRDLEREKQKAKAIEEKKRENEERPFLHYGNVSHRYG